MKGMRVCVCAREGGVCGRERGVSECVCVAEGCAETRIVYVAEKCLLCLCKYFAQI